jgi:hypothetical protein
MLECLDANEKVGFFLGMSELIIHNMDGNDYIDKIREALDLCWIWHETKRPTGDEIYSLLDDGTEFGGLFIYMQLDKSEKNEIIWDAIIDAVSYVNHEAFIFKNEKYVPEPIENVDDDIIEHFYNCCKVIHPDYETAMEKLVDYLKNNKTFNKTIVNDFLYPGMNRE